MRVVALCAAAPLAARVCPSAVGALARVRRVVRPSSAPLGRPSSACAHAADREARHHVEMASLYDDPGLPTTLISPEEVRALHPLVDTSHVECGVHTPLDGDIDPTLLTTCVRF